MLTFSLTHRHAARPLSVAVVACFASLISPYAAGATEFGPCAIETTVPEPVSKALDNVLTNAVDPEIPLAGLLGYAPGAVLSVEGPDWRYIKSMGVADPETGVALDCQSSFQIGSNTKMMTATVLLQLVEEGVLKLDGQLAEYLPDIAAKLPFGDVITIRQLAQHRSGVFSYTDNAPDGTPGIMEGAMADLMAMQRQYRPEEFIDFVIKHGEPNFAPGAEGEWSYSNTGYALLGLIIEKLEGKPIGDVYQERIFAPLGMSDTFLWNGVPREDFGLPRSYLRAPFELEATDWNMSQGWAAGGVVSTVDDMQVFISSLLSGDLFRDSGTLTIMQDAVVTGMPTLSRYGIGLGEKEPGLWGHGGQTLGFSSDVAEFESLGITVVGWATSSENSMAFGAASVAEALRETGVIEDPADAATDVLIEQLQNTAWHLVSVETNGIPSTIDAPEQYDLRFLNGNELAIKADCNRVNGDWSLKRLAFSIQLEPSTLVECPAGSESGSYLAALSTAISVSVPDDTLNIYANTTEGLTVLTFEAH